KLSSETSVGQPPTMLILDPQNMRQAEKLTWQMLIAFLRTLGFQVVTPEQEKRREIEGNRGARI
ncbi:unnamed protein product, partial [marine sediment metagenome]